MNLKRVGTTKSFEPIDSGSLKVKPEIKSERAPSSVSKHHSFKPQLGMVDLASSDVLGDIESSIDLSSSQVLQKRAQQLRGLTTGSLLPVVEKRAPLTVHDEMKSSAPVPEEHSFSESIKSTQKLLHSLADVSGDKEIQSVTGKVMQPLDTLDSTLSTKEAFKKLWDQPNIENMADLSLSLKTTIENMVESIESVPGGELLIKSLKHLVEGVAPGLETADLDEGFVALMMSVKKAAQDPSMKNIANAVLETVQFTASFGVATGIPIVAQIGKGIVMGVDVLQGLMEIDYSGLAKKASSALSSFGHWIGVNS